MQHGIYKRYRHGMLGPGGFKCPCCVPTEGKNRKEIKKINQRTQRKRMARDDRKLNLDLPTD